MNQNSIPCDNKKRKIDEFLSLTFITFHVQLNQILSLQSLNLKNLILYEEFSSQFVLRILNNFWNSERCSRLVFEESKKKTELKNPKVITDNFPSNIRLWKSGRFFSSDISIKFSLEKKNILFEFSNAERRAIRECQCLN